MPQDNQPNASEDDSLSNAGNIQPPTPTAKSATQKTKDPRQHHLSHVRASLWLYGIVTVVCVLFAYIYLYNQGVLPSWAGNLARSFSTFNGLIGGLISGGLITLIGKSSLQHFGSILSNANKLLALLLSVFTVGVLIGIPVVIYNSQLDPYIQKGKLDNNSLSFSNYSWYGALASCSQSDPFNISQTSQLWGLCFAKTSDYSNFIYEVKMTIISGDCGAILLRGDLTSGRVYLFEVCQNGTYSFIRFNKYGNLSDIGIRAYLRQAAPIPSFSKFKPGIGQENTLAVLAEGNKFTLYVNGGKSIDIVPDEMTPAYNDGKIGVAAISQGSDSSANVTYREPHVWKLS